MFEPVTGTALFATATPGRGQPNDAWSARASRALLQRVAPAAAPAGFVLLWPNTLLQYAHDGLAVLQVLPVATGLCTYRELRYALPDASRDMQLLRYLQRRARRQALQADARLLAKVQQGMANRLEPGPIAASEAGLRWFAARYRECSPPSQTPGPKARSSRRGRPRKPVTTDP